MTSEVARFIEGNAATSEEANRPRKPPQNKPIGRSYFLILSFVILHRLGIMHGIKTRCSLHERKYLEKLSRMTFRLAR